MLVAFLMLVCTCDGQKLWGRAPQYDFEGKLRLVHVIYRHGHTEPLAGYPKDPHKNSVVWTHGPGCLTILGRKQSFYFGQNLRSRYKSLLPATQSYKYVKASSSRSPRTMMTSASVLAGMLPPRGADVWSPIPWQPAVVNEDVSLSDEVNCPRLKSKKTGNYKIGDEKLYTYVSMNSGMLVATPTDMLSLYKCLETQNEAGLALPKWVVRKWAPIKKEASRAYEFDSDILRLKIGPLLRQITLSTPKDKLASLNIYCTHDSVIGGLLYALKINRSEPPNFLSALIVEIRELNREYHAQLFYRIGPYDDLIRFNWPGCGIKCPLSKLEAVLSHLLPKDWSSECELSNFTDLRILIPILFMLYLISFFIASSYGSLVCQLMFEILFRRKRLGKFIAV